MYHATAEEAGKEDMSAASGLQYTIEAGSG